jgi:hypothetical protein
MEFIYETKQKKQRKFLKKKTKKYPKGKFNKTKHSVKNFDQMFPKKELPNPLFILIGEFVDGIVKFSWVYNRHYLTFDQFY